jgi:aryl-alcohol dehydrogenase-like predicted oxidoreductase
MCMLTRRSFVAAGLALPWGASCAEPLPQRMLGKTGQLVTTYGLGCEDADTALIRRAGELGVSYFHLMSKEPGAYSKLGKAVHSWRKQVLLSTGTQARTKDEALSDLRLQLKAMGVGYLDIWFLQAMDHADELRPDLLEALLTARRDGRIRFAGITTHNLAGLLPAILRSGAVDVVMAPYNFALPGDADALVSTAHTNGLGLIAMKVLAGGAESTAESRRTWGADESRYTRLKRSGAMEAALRWVLRNPKVHNALVRVRTKEELEANLQSVSAPFSLEDSRLLADRGAGFILHRA